MKAPPIAFPVRYPVPLLLSIALVGLLLVPGIPGPGTYVRAPVSGGLSPLSPLSPFGSTLVPGGARYVGPMAADHPLSLVVALQYSHLGQLRAFLNAQRDPASPEYGRALTSAQFDAMFGPSAQERSDVRSYLLSHGATTVLPTGGGDLLSVTMPEGVVSHVFGTGMGWFSEGNAAPFFHETGNPVLPVALAGEVAGVSGLSEPSTFQHASTAAHYLPSSVSSQPGRIGQYDLVKGTSDQIFWGTDYQAVYNEGPILSSGKTGSGFAIATLLTSGFNQSTSQDLPPFEPAAIDLYYNLTFPPGASHPQPVGVPVTINGTTPPNPGPPPNVSGSYLQDDIGSVEENSLDLEMAGSMAPGASLYTFYFSGSLISQSLAGAYADFDTELGDALNYNYGAVRLTAVSNSWGLSDEQDAAWNNLEIKAQAMEVTLLASSGDQGDAPSSVQSHPQGQWPSFPATASYNGYGVMAIGGTQVEVSGTPTGTWDPNGKLIPTPGYDAPNITAVTLTQPWFTPSSSQGAYGGTEGGISPYVNEPQWQAESAAQSAIRYTASVEGTNGSRAVPDLALCGYDTIAFFEEFPGSGGPMVGMGIFDGTSISSPLFAGMVAVFSQDLGHPLGFFDPAVYNMSSYFLVHGGTGPFTSVPTGHNYLFNASSGWDALTGWGSPNAVLLASDLGNPTYANYVYNSSAVPGRATGTPPTGGHATATPPTSQSSIPVYYIILIAVVLMVVIILVASTRKPKQVYIAPPPPQYGYAQYPPPGYGGSAPPPPPPAYGQPHLLCANCRRTYPPQWGFCPYCGAVPR